MEEVKRFTIKFGRKGKETCYELNSLSEWILGGQMCYQLTRVRNYTRN